jgi:hypothetical protein
MTSASRSDRLPGRVPREPAHTWKPEELPDTVLHGVPLAAMETQRVAVLMAERDGRARCGSGEGSVAAPRTRSSTVRLPYSSALVGVLC